MLTPDRTVLTIVDVQGKLAGLMHERESLFRNLGILIQGAQILAVPILWVEQNPGGLGPTVAEVAKLLPGKVPIAKMSFSACGCPEYVAALEECGRTQVVLAGIEAHVCVYLTAADLLARGCEVQVVADAVSSRTAENKRIGLSRVEAAGGGVGCVESVLFELLRTAENESFRKIAQLLK